MEIYLSLPLWKSIVTALITGATIYSDKDEFDGRFVGVMSACRKIIYSVVPSISLDAIC